MLTERYVCGAAERAARGIPAGLPVTLDALAEYPLPVAREARVLAFVNHGRWLAGCRGCNGAEYVTRDYPFFWCDSCQMGWTQGKMARVVFPADADAAERLLGERRDARVRNWRPDEQPQGVTVAAWLDAENIVHGVTEVAAERYQAAKLLYSGRA